MVAFSKTIQIYIFDGNPNGRMMCELSNWNGRVYKISRSELIEFSKREDAQNTGVYFLFGKNEENIDTVYIGEAEKILIRLKQHLKDEMYWNDCIIVMSKDHLLNKAHIKYLEYQFYTLAKKSSHSQIINSTVPTCSSISEYDEAMLLEFMSNAKLLINTLRYKIFDSVKERATNQENQEMLFFIKTGRGAKATGIVVADGFAVLQGSAIAQDTVPSMSASLKQLRQRLLAQGVIDKAYYFVKDYTFTSPSTAASVVMGLTANGRVEWKTKEGKTFKEIEAAKSKMI